MGGVPFLILFFNPKGVIMKTKIALIVSGAVSLGSYEAGVIYELFYALQKLGKDAEFEIDVITGASAGSINSAVLAISMMYDPNLIKYLEKIWIEGLDIISLLKDNQEPEKSIFSNKIINDLKTDFLESAKNTNNPLPYAPKRIKVAFTLTNLTGIPYEIRYANKQQAYKSTTFADWYVVELEQGKKNINDLEVMLNMVVASGSFPFAFPAMNLKRKSEEYKGTAIDGSLSEELDFIYVDGGVFNNEPINRARRLADCLDESGASKRIYLLVDPTPPKAMSDFKGMTMLDIAKRLIPAVFTEAHFRDWYDASKVNQRLEWQEKAISSFIKSFHGFSSVQTLQMKDSLRDLALNIASFKAEKENKNPETYLAENRDRIAKQLQRKELIYSVNVENRESFQELITDFVFIFECVASLRDKKILDIRLLSPDEQGILAGDFLINFGAFFSKEYRIHDFTIGREVARKFLTKSKDENGLGVDLSKYNPKEYSYDKSLDKVTIKSVPSGQKKDLRDCLVERADFFVKGMLKVHHAGFFYRFGIPFALMVCPWGKLIPWITRKLVTKILNSALEIK